MHSQFWRFWTQIEIHPGAQIAEGVFIDHGSGLVIGETAVVEKGAMLYHGVTLGGTGKDVGKRHPTVREGALVSAHAQVIGLLRLERMLRWGRQPWLLRMSQKMLQSLVFLLRLCVFMVKRMKKLSTILKKAVNTIVKS